MLGLASVPSAWITNPARLKKLKEKGEGEGGRKGKNTDVAKQPYKQENAASLQQKRVNNLVEKALISDAPTVIPRKRTLIRNARTVGLPSFGMLNMHAMLLFEEFQASYTLTTNASLPLQNEVRCSCKTLGKARPRTRDQDLAITGTYTPH